MKNEVTVYNATQTPAEQKICDALMKIIDKQLPNAENKVWHRHPVWFLEGNPVVGYSKLKSGIRLMFWSGISFDEPELRPGTGKFKDASVTYTDAKELDEVALKRWLKKSKEIQWDYKNIVKRKGKLIRL